MRRSRPGDPVCVTMDIDLIFKIAAIGIIVSILNQVLSRSGREEQATMTTLAGLVVVLMMLAQKIADKILLEVESLKKNGIDEEKISENKREIQRLGEFHKP